MDHPSRDHPDVSGATNEAKAPCGRRVLLGLFILGQLIFLLIANVAGMIDSARREGIGPPLKPVLGQAAPGFLEEKGHLWEFFQFAHRTAEGWQQLTGQYQTWSLFTAPISRDITFPAVALRWDEDRPDAVERAGAVGLLAAAGPAGWLPSWVATQRLAAPAAPVHKEELLLSDNEPRDWRQFFRAGQFRLRRLETTIVVDLIGTEHERAEQIRSLLRDYGALTLAYLRWRVDEYQSRHADRPAPRQVILSMRRYRVHEVGDVADGRQPRIEGPLVHAAVRWRPHAIWTAGQGPLEMFNPESACFEPFSP